MYMYKLYMVYLFIQVRAINSEGEGMYSDYYNFSTSSSSTEQIFTAGPIGGELQMVPGGGVERSFPSVSAPVAVDAKNRRVFWYELPSNTIFELSLDIDTDPKVSILVHVHTCVCMQLGMCASTH